MMLELNKDCKEYSHVSGKCVNTTKGEENPSKESLTTRKPKETRKSEKNAETNLQTQPHTKQIRRKNKSKTSQ